MFGVDRIDHVSDRIESAGGHVDRGRGPEGAGDGKTARRNALAAVVIAQKRSFGDVLNVQVAAVHHRLSRIKRPGDAEAGGGRATAGVGDGQIARTAAGILNLDSITRRVQVRH